VPSPEGRRTSETGVCAAFLLREIGVVKGVSATRDNQEVPLRIKDKVAVITGAGSGIGRATAELFGKEGAKVIAVDIDEKTGGDTANRILQSHGHAHFVKADISQESQAKNISEEAIATFGRIDILVNNAATFVLKGFDASLDELRRSFDVNVAGTVMVTKHAIEFMKESGGAIVNLGSISSFIAQPDLFAYSFTKAAILQLTRNMAMDLARYGVRVNCVCPGPVLTPALLKKYNSDLPRINREEGALTFLEVISKPFARRS
jgi:NAD(P)-dependent dehydrogenase (short-subunit alcohol dehydrogenase family)